jgi:muramidase (phage lysozyme)
MNAKGVGYLARLRASGNLRAFLHVIRAGESSQADDAYRMQFGGALVPELRDHPRQPITRGHLTSTAAGAYQFLSRTWDDCVAALALPDFGPQSQDVACVFLLDRRGALADVQAGQLEAAVRKCAREWASLPFSPYGQPTRTLEQARATYTQFGGTYMPDNETSTVTASAAPGDPATGAAVGQALVAASGLVSPFISAAIKVLSGLLPSIAKEFGGTEVSDRNLKLAAAAVQVVQDAVGAANPIEAVSKVQGDPQALQRASDALTAAGFGLDEVGGGIPAARKASSEAGDWWRQPAMWVTLALLPLVYFVVWQVMLGEGWSSEVRSMVVAAIVTGLLGGISGYWLGTSYGSQRKTDMLAGRS